MREGNPRAFHLSKDAKFRVTESEDGNWSWVLVDRDRELAFSNGKFTRQAAHDFLAWLREGSQEVDLETISAADQKRTEGK